MYIINVFIIYTYTIMSCPVVVAIGEIYGSGVSDESQNVIKVGSYDVIVDEMSFYIAQRKLSLARLELRKPSDDVITKFYHANYAKFAAVTYKDVFMAIYPPNTHLYNKFTALIDLLGCLEDTLQSYVLTLRHGTAITLSLPSLMLLPLIDRLIMYNHNALTQTVNKIVDYINRFSIHRDVSESVPHILPFIMSLDMTKQMPAPTTHTIASMHAILDDELIVATYARALEKYQVDAYNHMDKIFVICEKIIDNMITAQVND